MIKVKFVLPIILLTPDNSYSDMRYLEKNSVMPCLLPVGESIFLKDESESGYLMPSASKIENYQWWEDNDYVIIELNEYKWLINFPSDAATVYAEALKDYKKSGWVESELY